MDDQRIGAVVRAVRVRRRWRQEDVAAQANRSRTVVSRIERGHAGRLRLRDVRAVAEALDIRLDILARWQGGELDRLLNSRHSAMHERVARLFAGLVGWQPVPEVSFSIYGERGVIDVLAWHASSRSVLVVELKTEIVDVQDLVGTIDKKRRLVRRIARDRGWRATHVATWLLVAEGSTNRRHVAAHATMLRHAFPAERRRIEQWLTAPAGSIDAMSFLSTRAGVGEAGANGSLAPVKRVRPRAAAGGQKRAGGNGHAV